MRALIVGIDSTLGNALAESLAAAGVDVLGTTRRVGEQRPQRLMLDLAAPEAAAWQPPKVDIAIFAAAIAKFSDCRSDPLRAYRVNVASPAAIAQRLAANGSNVLLLSTSAVFPGSKPCVRPDESPSPRSVYGRLKAEAEAEFLKLGQIACVARLTKVITPRLQLLRGWVSALQRRETVRAFSDLTVSPIPLDHTVACLVAIAKAHEGGIFQISGADDVSYDEVASYLAERLGAPPEAVRRCRAVDEGIPPEEIARFTSLDASRVAALCGRAAPDWRNVIEEVIAAT
jgi:dTDP-4-dehydrorhamnose reductase